MQKRSFTAGGFSPDRGKREEMACAVRANPAEPGRWGGRTRRQNGAVRWTAGRGGRTGRRTRRQNRAARRIGRTRRQDGAAEKEGGGKAGSSQRTGPGAPPAQTKKTGETIGPARFSAGIPTAGSRRTAKKRTEKRGPTPAKRRNAQALNTLFGHREECNIIRTAAVTKITESNFSIFLHSDHSFQAHSRTHPWSFRFSELCPEANCSSVSANLRRHRAAFDLRFFILCTIFTLNFIL